MLKSSGRQREGLRNGYLRNRSRLRLAVQASPMELGSHQRDRLITLGKNGVLGHSATGGGHKHHTSPKWTSGQSRAIARYPFGSPVEVMRPRHSPRANCDRLALADDFRTQGNILTVPELESLIISVT